MKGIIPQLHRLHSGGKLSPLVILFGEEAFQFSVLGTEGGNLLQILRYTRPLQIGSELTKLTFKEGYFRFEVSQTLLPPTLFR